MPLPRYLLATARPVAEDLAGTLIFYLLFLASGSALAATLAGLSVGAGQAARHRRRGERVPGLLAVGIALTIGLGGLSLVFHDPRFVLAKPSIAYALVAATMARRGWVARYLPPIARPLLGPETLDRVGWGWAALMAGMALLNLALLALLPPMRAATLFVAAAAASKLLLFAGQYAVLRPRAVRAYHARAAGQ